VHYFDERIGMEVTYLTGRVRSEREALREFRKRYRLALLIRRYRILYAEKA
jgi:hypothetical protein